MIGGNIKIENEPLAPGWGAFLGDLDCLSVIQDSKTFNSILEGGHNHDKGKKGHE